MAIENKLYDHSRSAIYNTKWASPAFFKISELHLATPPPNTTIPSDNLFVKKANVSDQLSTLLNSAISNINTPNISSQPIHEWVGGTWVYTNGRPEMRQVDITFKDTEQYTFWYNFVNVYNGLKFSYPDECKWQLTLRSVPMNRILQKDILPMDAECPILIQTNDAILTSISPIQMSQDSSDSFATFTVTFMYHIQNHTNLTGKGV